MTPIEHIRKNVFGLSQTSFAEIAGTTQPSVSRWENGELEPDREALARIRSAAQARGLNLKDCMFFEIPEAAP